MKYKVLWWACALMFASGLGMGSALADNQTHPGWACQSKCSSAYSLCRQSGIPQYYCDQEYTDCLMACQT